MEPCSESKDMSMEPIAMKDRRGQILLIIELSQVEMIPRASIRRQPHQVTMQEIQQVDKIMRQSEAG